MSYPNSIPLLNDPDDPNVPKCNCHKPVEVKRQEKKGINQYRYFFCCGNGGEIYQRCQFFKWVPTDKKILGCKIVDK